MEDSITRVLATSAVYHLLSPGHHGTGVVSYFVFLRYLLLVNLSMFLLTMFIWIPEAILDGTALVSGSTADTCTAAYTVNVSSDAFTLFLDFFQGSVSVSLSVVLLLMSNGNDNDNIGDLYSALTTISTTRFAKGRFTQKGRHSTTDKTHNDYNIRIHAFKQLSHRIFHT